MSIKKIFFFLYLYSIYGLLSAQPVPGDVFKEYKWYIHVFEQGENILKTGKTPRYRGKMVHGVEVQWPGIMVLIKDDLTGNIKTEIH